jgi:DNA-binding PadR family transcriptional regulator
MDERTQNGLTAFQSRIDRVIVGALRGQDLSGFEIWRWLGSDEGAAGLLTEADLYPTLYRLEAEHLLGSDWHEGERTRRKYRLTAKALELADEHGWPAIAFHGQPRTKRSPDAQRTQAPMSGDVRPDRAISPDPDAGSWFLPPKTETLSAESASTGEHDRSGGGSPADRESSVDPSAASSDGHQRVDAATDRYSDELGAALDLPRTEADRVRREIADHLSDAASALEHEGWVANAAVLESISRLGGARDLANRIGRAQHTADRLNRGIRRGVVEFVAEMVMWLALSVVPLVLAPGVSDVLILLGRLAGLQLTVLRSGEWATNQMAITLCVGAFATGRMSLGYLARNSRHSDAAFRKPWAIGGGLAVLVIALLVPGRMDSLVVATLLAAPIAFVAGTFRPKHVNESSYTVRGLVQAALVIAAVTLLPGGRLFAFDPNGTPGVPLAPDRGPGELNVVQLPDGTFTYEVKAAAGTGTVTIELWPASTDGLFVVVDRSAAGPMKVADQGVDLSKLPPNRLWWVVAVSTGPDGRRTAVAVAVQTGDGPRPSNALSWLLSKL